jgi:protein required for attachment to host cells
MNTVWLLVCDAAHARIFEIQSNLNGVASKWESIQTFEHATSRLRTGEIVSDTALAASSSPKETEKDHFKHELVGFLDQAMRSHKFKHLVLCAPPQFLGKLKNELSSELKTHLLSTVDKDLTHLSGDALTERLKEDVKIPIDQLEMLREPLRTNSHSHS